MIVLELDRELASADVDVGSPSRPQLIQPRVDADNFPDRPLARIGTRTRSEPHPQRVAEVLLQGCVVGLDAATFALNNTRPSIDSQRPSRVCTLFATATWV